MSKKDGKTSGEGSGQTAHKAVFDFLYHDPTRIGSFLAQLNPLGHITGFRSSESAGSTRSSKNLLGAKGGVPGVASASMSGEDSEQEQEQESSERSYDPLWTNACVFIDYLEKNHLVHRDLKRARIGQFILVSGELSVLNVSLLKRIWEAPTVRAAAIAQATANITAQLVATPNVVPPPPPPMAQAQATAAAWVEILPLLPHSVQATVTGKDAAVWTSLSEDNLVGTASDLSLKHGSEIPGGWCLLGILDALPSPIPAQIQIVPTPTLQHMDATARNFANVARTLLGRPPGAYGVTPILIYREISP